MTERTYRALLVTNSTFPEDPHNLPELKGPVNDLALMRDALTDETFGLFDSRHVRLVPERSKAEITIAMEQFFREAGRDDQLLLYYSGHGMQDNFDNLYLCARDTRTDLLASTGISDTEMNGIMRMSAAQTFVVVLDCCHSGGFKSGGLPTNLRGTGRFLLTSSRRGQLSTDTPEINGPSAFTRHLADGLLGGTTDANGDGYVSLNEVYDYVLERLRVETKQIPQRHFDNVVGDIALARAVARSHERTRPLEIDRSHERPSLDVSQTEIDIRDVQPDEELPTEVIDVFNTGGGTLDWTAESDADWISIREDGGFFSMQLSPRPGMNRGIVRVRDHGRGGAKTVRVTVQVRELQQPPVLELSTSQIDFGTLSCGVQSPRRTVGLLNRGGGELRATAVATDPRIDLHQYGDSVSVGVDTSAAGDVEGDIVVDSAGGQQRVWVRATIEAGPLLRVEPPLVDFGRVRFGEEREVHVTVANAGSGSLEYRGGQIGDFFDVQRVADGLRVRLSAGVGMHHGSIWIRSNGGEVAMDVKAHVLPVAGRWDESGEGQRGAPGSPVRKNATPTPKKRASARGLVVGSYALAVMAVFFLPVLLGPLAAFLGWRAHRRGAASGKVAMWIAIVATVIGSILGAMVLSESLYYYGF